MKKNQVETIIGALVQEAQSGNQEAKAAYGTLIRAYNTWNTDKSPELWEDVVAAAQRALQLVPIRDGEAGR